MMNDRQSLGQAIGFIATISLIFILCYVFQITKTPFFFLLVGIMSFGYMLSLLAFLHEKSTKKFYIYFLIGLFFIILCVGLSFTIPHESSFFN